MDSASSSSILTSVADLAIENIVFCTALFGAAVFATISQSEKSKTAAEETEEETAAVEIEIAVVAEEDLASGLEDVDGPMEPEPQQTFITATEKDLVQLKKEVASTIEGEQEKIKRLATKEQSKAKEAAQRTQQAEDKTAEEVKESLAVASGSAPETKHTGKRHFVARIVKKIVMPWRKWESL